MSRSGHKRDLIKDIQSISNALGTAVPGRGGKLIEHLQPHDKSDAYPTSLSRIFGKSEQPFHVDHSHRPVPCRFLVFGCASKGAKPAPTWLLDTQNFETDARTKELLQTSVFAVKNGRMSFYSTVIPRSQIYWRWDPGCMYPTSKDAKTLAQFLTNPKAKAQAFSIDWKKNDILVLDNWRYLHARGACQLPENSRTLMRVSIQ